MKRELKRLIGDYAVGILVVITAPLILGLLRLLFPKVFQSIWQGVTTVGDFLLSAVSLPVWVVGVFLLMSLFTIRLVILRFVPKETNVIEYQPRLNEYNEDFIFEMVWRWDRIYDNFPDPDIWCRCPACYTRLVAMQLPRLITGRDERYTEFYCETHHEVIAEIPGKVEDIMDRVARQIERKVATGEWRDVVRRSRAGDLVPKIERPPME